MRRFSATVQWFAGISALFASSFVAAGPPLITNDTGTPGDGHWEFDFAAAGERIDGQWELAAPDLDINYGLGESIQLTAHLSWNHRHAKPDGWMSAPGTVELAVRWRFLDEDRNGISMAIQPHWESRGLRGSVRKELAPAGQEWVLPLQINRSIGLTTLGVEIARHWSTQDEDAWQYGAYLQRACGSSWVCVAEVNATNAADSSTETILNFGVQHEFSKTRSVIVGLGKQVGGEKPRASPFLYLGIQLLR
jgi:hypothetical protein